MLVAVEGNIGSGKSTLLKYLENIKLLQPHKLIYEQVDEWKNLKDSNGNNMFELFYKDPKKYSYLFQTYVLLSRIQYLINSIKENPDHIIICERSHLTDLMVFAKSLFESNELNEMEYTVYKNWHKMVSEFFNIKLDRIIFVNADPEKCLERIKKRNRNGEEGISLEYLDILHKNHINWLKNMDNVLELNGNIDLDEDCYNSNINIIKQYLTK